MKFLKKYVILTAIFLLLFADINSVYAKTNLNEKAVFLCAEDRNKYYIAGDSLIKLELVEEIPVVKQVRQNSLIKSSELIKEKNVNIKLSSTYIDEKDKNNLLNPQTRAGWLTRTDESMNVMGNIRAKLSVVYTDNSNEELSDGYDLTLKSATGTWSRAGAIEGVYPQTSELYYGVTGSIYDSSGNFIKNGFEGFTKKFSTPTFTNISLMGGKSAQFVVSAGVNYTIHCTRGVTVTVNMQFA